MQATLAESRLSRSGASRFGLIPLGPLILPAREGSAGGDPLGI